MKHINLFLSSGYELLTDRIHIGDLTCMINSHFDETRVVLSKWEYVDSSYKTEGSQEFYNKEIKKCNIFVALFKSRLGIYTKEEVELAQKLRETEDLPLLYCFFRKIDKEDLKLFDLKELNEYRKKGLEGFKICEYDDIKELQCKIAQIILSNLSDCGYEDDVKFIKINNSNLLKK